MQPNSTDQWQWKVDPSGGYSIRGVYKLLTGQEFHRFKAITNLIWHKQVPFKVSIFAWKVLQNRLPTKDNLVVCDIITHDAQLCVTGCGCIEMT